MTGRGQGTAASSVLWERELPVSRNRNVRLTAVEVAAAAFGLAEAEQLHSVSVKRVANRLGIPAPRLEQYLPDRETMLDLMLEQAIGEIELPDADDDADGNTDWRARAEQLATSTYRVVQRHPWLVELIGGRPATGPNGLRYVERSLAVMRAGGLDIGSAALCVNAMLAFVAGSARAQASRRAAAQRADSGYLAAVVGDGPYPQLRDLFATEDSVTADESFARGLHYLLDGVAARLPDPATAGAAQ